MLSIFYILNKGFLKVSKKDLSSLKNKFPKTGKERGQHSVYFIIVFNKGHTHVKGAVKSY